MIKKNYKNKIKFYVKQITDEKCIKSIRYAVTLANFTFIFTLIFALYDMISNSKNIMSFENLCNWAHLPTTISIIVLVTQFGFQLFQNKTQFVYIISTIIRFISYILLYLILIDILKYLFLNILIDKYILFKVLGKWYFILFVIELIKIAMKEINMNLRTVKNTGKFTKSSLE